jgi:hypothetical protein
MEVETIGADTLPGLCITKFSEKSVSLGRRYFDQKRGMVSFQQIAGSLDYLKVGSFNIDLDEGRVQVAKQSVQTLRTDLDFAIVGEMRFIDVLSPAMPPRCRHASRAGAILSRHLVQGNIPQVKMFHVITQVLEGLRDWFDGVHCTLGADTFRKYFSVMAEVSPYVYRDISLLQVFPARQRIGFGRLSLQHSVVTGAPEKKLHSRRD